MLSSQRRNRSLKSTLCVAQQFTASLQLENIQLLEHFGFAAAPRCHVLECLDVITSHGTAGTDCCLLKRCFAHPSTRFCSLFSTARQRVPGHSLHAQPRSPAASNIHLHPIRYTSSRQVPEHDLPAPRPRRLAAWQPSRSLQPPWCRLQNSAHRDAIQMPGQHTRCRAGGYHSDQQTHASNSASGCSKAAWRRDTACSTRRGVGARRQVAATVGAQRVCAQCGAAAAARLDDAAGDADARWLLRPAAGHRPSFAARRFRWPMCRAPQPSAIKGMFQLSELC